MWAGGACDGAWGARDGVLILGMVVGLLHVKVLVGGVHGQVFVGMPGRGA